MEIGTPLPLTGTVVPSNATNKTIVWSKKTAGTTATANVSDAGVVNATGVGNLIVTATIANGLTETTPYTKDFTIQVYGAGQAPTVTGVTVTPATPSVVQGGTQLFSAVVAGTNTPSQSVTWTITATGAINGGTSITSAGLLTVAIAETNTTLKVRATSDVNNTKFAEATVTVPVPSLPGAGPTWSAVGDSKFGLSDNIINGIAYGNNKFVAVGAKGKMAHSTNGTEWTAVASGTVGGSGFFSSTAIYGIAYGGGKWVAGGENGKMAQWNGTDETWTVIANNTFAASFIRGIAYGNGKWVAVGDEGKIAHWDGSGSWQAVTPGLETGQSQFTGNIYGIAWNGSKFVAVGAGGRMATSTDGATWAPITAAQSTFIDEYSEPYDIRGIAWGGNKFIAVGRYGRMAYSDNGTAWTAIPPGTGNGTSQFDLYSDINGIAYGNNKFVAVGYGGKMAYSN